MKKCLPLLLLVLLAFAGCNSGAVEYQTTRDPHQVVANAEKFVNKVAKNSKHYSAEDWDNAVNQFVSMSKNYFEFRNRMTTEERMAFDKTRVRFMNAVDASGSDELALRVKKEYGKLMEN